MEQVGFWPDFLLALAPSRSDLSCVAGRRKARAGGIHQPPQPPSGARFGRPHFDQARACRGLCHVWARKFRVIQAFAPWCDVKRTHRSAQNASRPARSAKAKPRLQPSNTSWTQCAAIRRKAAPLWIRSGGVFAQTALRAALVSRRGFLSTCCCRSMVCGRRLAAA